MLWRRLFSYTVGAVVVVAALAFGFLLVRPAAAQGPENDPGIQLGPRPFYLVDDMDEG